MEDIDLKELFNFFKQKLTIILLVIAAVTALGGCYSAFCQKPLYESKSTVILTSGETTITQADVNLSASLTSTYAEMAKSRRVLNQVIEALKLEDSYEELAAKISVNSEAKSSIIHISTTASDPYLAKDIASAVAHFFTQEVRAVYKLDNATVFDEAILNEKPSNLAFGKSFIIYLAIGVVLACGIVFMMFYFDPSIKSAEEIERNTKLQILGKVHHSPRIAKNGDLITHADPKAIISEDLRTVRTNLLLSMASRNEHTFLVTSSTPGEGKSFISTNLAITLAQNGKSVLLIDCDMRRGRLHQVFEAKSRDGLSRLLSSNITLENIKHNLCATTVPHLYLITRGETPNNPSELLNARIGDLIEKAKNKFDYVIMDGTPVQGLPDALTLANEADKTIIVCAGNKTSLNTLQSTERNLRHINAKIAGVVYNQDKNRHDGYYGYYGEEA